MNGLALGTVQFGLDYGIKNERGRVPEEEVRTILEAASSAGIDTLDTAAAYGDSERVLGAAMRDGCRVFKVVSKLLSEPVYPARDELIASLERLGLDRLYAYMFHSSSTYERNPACFHELAECKAAGLVEKIGFSLYRPEEAERLLDSGLGIDIVQVPYNLLDRRFERIFGRLKSEGVEIHVRSVFLQGLLLMDSTMLDDRFDSVRGQIKSIETAGRESGLDAATLCIGFAAHNTNVDRIIIGVDGMENLQANIRAFNRRSEASPVLERLGDISVADENIILPFKWKKA